MNAAQQRSALGQTDVTPRRLRTYRTYDRAAKAAGAGPILKVEQDGEELYIVGCSIGMSSGIDGNLTILQASRNTRGHTHVGNVRLDLLVGNMNAFILRARALFTREGISTLF